MGYAAVTDIIAGFKDLDADEKARAETLIEEAAVIIDSFNETASEDIKKVVTCRMVRRALATPISDVPMGASQGTMSALGYSQSWTLSNGSSGELYVSAIEKRMLGISNRIGIHSPLED